MLNNNTLNYLPTEKRSFIELLALSLVEIRGVQAVVLGGSYARQRAHQDSDIDIGIYYEEADPLAINEIAVLAQKLSSAKQPTLTQLYEWGAWVNGGAWLYTEVGKVDLLYKNRDQINRVIADAERGIIAWDYLQQPPYGFHSVTYLAETRCCQPIVDPLGRIAELKTKVQTYPEPLKKATVQQYLWGAEFSIFHTKKYAQDIDPYTTAGGITRTLAYLTQVLYALNEQYFICDREAMDDIEQFVLHPSGYGESVRTLFSHWNPAEQGLLLPVQILEQLFLSVVALADGLYKPKYTISA